MKITISNFEFESQNSTFSLPQFMTKLCKEDFELACSSEDKNVRIIAAGTDPQDQKIVLLTASGKVLVFDARKFYIPPGPSEPSEGGSKIFLKNIDGRWPGNSEGFLVNASWIIDNSSSALEDAIILTNFANYSHEDQTK